MEKRRLTKFDTDEYNAECMNCDDVFFGGKKELTAMADHEAEHRKAFKKAGKKIPTGFWRR